MKQGDKIVCVNSKNFITFDDKPKVSVKKIEENKIYTVVQRGASNDVLLKEVPGAYYHTERFVSLNEYRRIKVKRIKNKINGR